MTCVCMTCIIYPKVTCVWIYIWTILEWHIIYSRMTCECMTCIIYPRVTCACIDMWTIYFRKQDKTSITKHVIVWHFLREINCFIELSKANLFPKYCLTKAMVQFIFPIYFILGKRHKKITRTQRLNSYKV